MRNVIARYVSRSTGGLGRKVLIMAIVALLLPAFAAASPEPVTAPFSIGPGLRHGPERLPDAEPPRALLGAPYSFRFQSEQEPAPAFSAASADLPPGLGLSHDGVLSGVPTAAGRFFFVVLAFNGVSEGTEQQVSMDIVAPPAVTLAAASPFGPTKAELVGWVDPGNLPTTAWFEYWPVSEPVPKATPPTPVGRGTTPVETTFNVEDLTPGVPYEFRIAAVNEAASGPVSTAAGRVTTTLPPPEAGKTFNVEPVQGKVRTRCASDDSFTRLKRPRQVTLDCRIDTQNGTVSLTASRGSSGQTQSARFWGGLFSVFQRTGDNRYAVLRLTGKRRCEKKGGRRRRALRGGHQARARKSKRRRRRGRKLWGKGSGNYRTVGSHGAATVRGTTWLVDDRCDGATVFRVRTGTVVVTDFIKMSKLTLGAGQSYVAKADFDRLP